MIIQFMGPQACGKGTQGKMLSEKLGIPFVGLGNILRALPPAHKYYKKVHEKLDLGELVDHSVVADLLRERLSLPDCAKGFILDGYTRAKEQLDHFNPNPDYVIFVDIPREETIKRISGRRVCTADGETYNINIMTPEELQKCSGELVQRGDDKEEAINRRLDIFDKETRPVIEMYKKLGKLIQINGLGTPEEVFGRVISALELSQKSKLGYN